MAYIKTVRYEDSHGPVRDAYDQVYQKRGMLPNVLAVNAARPHIMKSIESHSRIVMQTESGLTPAERQMIAAVVSGINECVY
ncbi:MAG: carboxymuconolactone decarboxylase family protein [Chloroflexi bacterium]|nr:carboxymuconolactone decarboxylase family protein [Chloroflexota bacterium]MDA1227164.1 carboxymuconolactone decarboxylase family protein [Chloroflexota bacterium]